MAVETSTVTVRLPADDRVEPRETSGLTTRLILEYVERAGGRSAVDLVLRRCGLTGREDQLRDENCWFADALRVRLFEAAAIALDDPLVARHIGEAAIDFNVGQTLKLALRGLGSPRLIYSNIVRANAKFNSVHRMDVLELGNRRARIRNVPLGEAEYHPTDCEYNVGLLSCVPSLFGQPPARVEHSVCIGTGATDCVYEVEWRGDDGARSALRLGLAAVGGMAGCRLVAPELTPAATIAAAGAVALGGWRTLSSRRRRWRSLEDQLREQADAAERLTASMHDLVSALHLDEVLAKVTSNAQAAVGGSEFALLVEESRRLRCRSSSDLPLDGVAQLERWARSVPDLLEAPVLIHDIAAVEELRGLADDPHMHLGSLCAAPVVYRGRPLGVLVALASGAEGFLPRDVKLLESYAAQAAIALTNARLYLAQRELATQDPLTGLLNHREFHETVARELERCRRYGGEMSVVVLDLDNFKQVNDAGGHAAGDRVLRQVAETLADTRRASDLAFRIGGDEFALVLPNTGAGEAEHAAERACSAVATVDSRTTASYGLASWPDAGPTKDALLAHADTGLYGAKRPSGHRGTEIARADAGTRTPPSPIDTAHQRERLACASRMATKLAPLLDPEEIARTAVNELDRSFDYLIAGILRADPDGTLRQIAGAGALSTELPGSESWTQSVDEGVVGRAARAGEPALVSDTRRDPDFMLTDASVATGSELATPIRVGGEIWGVLNLEHTETDGFDSDDVLFADMVGAAVGAAIHRSQLFAELDGAFTRTLAVLSDALEAKDSYTAAHARKVAELSEQVGVRLGMTPGELRNLGYGALLHDIGKIGVRSELLNRPDALAPEEFEEVKLHTVIGAQMLGRISYFSEVHPLVRWAHERWDGQGYPDGRKQEEIPLGARVIAACDALHAMTSDRAYRRAMPLDAALGELRAHSGAQFDPAVVDVLVGLHAESGVAA